MSFINSSFSTEKLELKVFTSSNPSIRERGESSLTAIPKHNIRVLDKSIGCSERWMRVLDAQSGGCFLLQEEGWHLAKES